MTSALLNLENSPIWCLWHPAFFGVKPELVIKGGMIAWAAMGDANASIPTPQPVLYRPMFGGFGGNLSDPRTDLLFSTRGRRRSRIRGSASASILFLLKAAANSAKAT